MNEDGAGNRQEGHGNTGGFIVLAAVVALLAFGLLLSVANRGSNGPAAAGLNQMFAQIQQSADAAAAASSPISLAADSACAIDRSSGSVRFHVVVRNDDTLESITTARPVVQLTNGDAISRGEDDQLLQIPAGMTRTLDVLVPYGEQEPASCAVTLSAGAGGSVPMRSGSTAA